LLIILRIKKSILTVTIKISENNQIEIEIINVIFLPIESTK